MLDVRETGPLMTVREASQILHVHANTLRRWSDEGFILSYRISNRGDRRFKREDVCSLLVELTRHNGNITKSGDMKKTITDDLLPSLLPNLREFTASASEGVPKR